MSDVNQRIIFFDGVCGMCNSFVDWVIKRDTQDKFLFSPIQGQTAKEQIKELPLDPQEWSIVYLNADSELKEASDAVLNILYDIGGFWKCVSYLSVLPRSFRDYFYRFIAKRRYRWFKKKDQCRIPTAEERSKFLP